MPLYEYECSVCHKHTEKIQKFSDPEITACPFCGGPLQRVISAPAFALKGGGWFADGYGSARSGPGGEKAAGEKAGGDKAAGESAPAAATPAAAPAAAPAAPASTGSSDK